MDSCRNFIQHEGLQTDKANQKRSILKNFAHGTLRNIDTETKKMSEKAPIIFFQQKNGSKNYGISKELEQSLFVKTVKNSGNLQEINDLLYDNYGQGIQNRLDFHFTFA